jgi:2-C-methyl-D-erythritol 2,4-cyclodiphosphate synthase
MMQAKYRIGTGFDVHRTEAGAKLVLGTAEIPSDTGLVSETDGDVISHALIDALFAAAGLGDIGEHFPPDGSQRGRSSRELLTQAMREFRAAGMTLEQVDVTVFADCVRLSPHYRSIKEALAGRTGLPAGDISVKARTMEGLGEVGTGKAMAALVVVLATASARTERATAESRLFGEDYPLAQVGEVAPGVIAVCVDGASRGNPGPAAAAAIGRDAEGAALFEEGKYLGEATSNEAEYSAVLLALDCLERAGAHRSRVVIQLDSALVFSQLTGKFKVKDTRMRELHREALLQLRSFADVKFRKIPRAENSEADMLANRVLNNQSK